MIGWNKFDSKADLETVLAGQIEKIVKEAVKQRGKAALLFSGGSTPKALMNLLATKDFPWDKIILGLVDDRMVPYESEFSNAAMLDRELVGQIEFDAKPNVLPLVYMADMPDENLQRALEGAEQIGVPDVILLGMGGDGHFASLFPNDNASSNGLLPDNEEDILYTKAPAYPNHRISFSWAYLRKCKNLFLHITGEGKKELIENTNREELPIDTVLNDASAEVQIFWSK